MANEVEKFGSASLRRIKFNQFPRYYGTITSPPFKMYKWNW